MDNFTIFIYFMAYSLIGWALETVYCSLLEGKFVYRGFLNGPICPIYGFGALLVLAVLGDFSSHPLILYGLGLVLATSLEYIASYLLERFFNMKWWDYSKKRFNIKGRVCLWNSTLFGLLALVLIYWVHPRMVALLDQVSQAYLRPLATGLFLLFGLDTIVTVAELLNLKPDLAGLESRIRELEADLESSYSDLVARAEKRQLEKEIYKGYLAQEREFIRQGLEAKIEDRIRDIRLGFSTRRIVKSYPNLRSELNPRSIRKIKEYIRRK